MKDKRAILKRSGFSVLVRILLGNFSILGTVSRLLIGWVVAVSISYKINKYARVIFLKINTSEKTLSQLF